MSPEPPSHHLAKAGRFLAATRTLLAAGLAEQATSDAYYAAFHAARDLSRLLSDRLLADYAVAGEIDLAAAMDAARLATGLIGAILPVLVARDRASAAAAEAVRRELGLLDRAAR